MPHFTKTTLAVVKPTSYTLQAAESTKPITLAEVKSFLKIDDSDSDSELTLLIDVVTNKAEQITGRDFITKTYKTYLDCFPTSSSIGIEILKSRLQTITSVKYLVSGVLTTFDSTNYYITDKQEYAAIWLFDTKTYPTDVDVNRRQAVEIIFTAGYGATAAAVPADLRRAMLGHVNLLNENRGDCIDEAAINLQIAQLYLPYVVSRKLICII